MRKSFGEFRRVVIEGVDGSGKSTAAHDAALQLSDTYPDADIRVADSSGVIRFRSGEPIHTTAPWLAELEPTQGQSKLRALGQLGLYTLMRQATEVMNYRPNSLTIGVRDPYRIDPAAYASVYGPRSLQTASALQRLHLFHSLTLAPHPDAIVLLQNDDSTQALAHTTARETNSAPHETAEGLDRLSQELFRVVQAYGDLFGRPISEVQALTPHTTDDIAAHLERFVPSGRMRTGLTPALSATDRRRSTPSHQQAA